MKYIDTIIRLVFLALFFVVTAMGNMMLWFGLIAFSLILAIFFGRFYCGYVCPMNTLMRPAEWISKKLNIQSKNTPKFLEKDILPWIFLLLSVALMFIGKKVIHVSIPVLLIWLVASALMTLRFKPGLFHNYICPFGALQRLFGKYSIRSKSVSTDACIGCGKCETVCKSDAITLGDNKKAIISKDLCHQCNSCSDICPTNAIHYRKLN